MDSSGNGTADIEVRSVSVFGEEVTEIGDIDEVGAASRTKEIEIGGESVEITVDLWTYGNVGRTAPDRTKFSHAALSGSIDLDGEHTAYFDFGYAGTVNTVSDGAGSGSGGDDEQGSDDLEEGLEEEREREQQEAGEKAAEKQDPVDKKSGGGLPITGAALGGLIAAGVAALGGGGGALYLSRRKKSSTAAEGDDTRS